MNLPQTVMSNSIVTQPSALFSQQSHFYPHTQCSNNNEYNAYQLPLQLSQYYNVFPDVPSTKTSWTFPNGCVTSNIVRFTANPVPSSPAPAEVYRPSGIAPIKRKSLTSENEPHSSKIFISEEKMAARMSSLHISNNYVPFNINNTEASTVNSEVDEVEIDCSSETAAEPQLIVCDELRNLNRDIRSIIPEPLMPFEKPSTALVLWRPPMSYLNIVNVTPEEEAHSSVIITDITDRPDLDNNNISTVDLNSFHTPQTTFDESMEV